jgi:hypothetical protein
VRHLRRRLFISKLHQPQRQLQLLCNHRFLRLFSWEQTDFRWVTVEETMDLPRKKLTTMDI